jgi:hypothetical protein
VRYIEGEEYWIERKREKKDRHNIARTKAEFYSAKIRIHSIVETMHLTIPS